MSGHCTNQSTNCTSVAGDLVQLGVVQTKNPAGAGLIILRAKRA